MNHVVYQLIDFNAQLRSTSLSHSWVRRSGNMFGIDITLKLKCLHGFDCPIKHAFLFLFSHHEKKIYKVSYLSTKFNT